MAATTEYHVRISDVTSAPWRRTSKTQPEEGFNLTHKFRSFYRSFEGQLPELLAQRIFGPDDVTLRGHEVFPDDDDVDPAADETVETTGHFDRVEVVLFSLPFPKNQIVATVVLDFATADRIDDESSLLRRLLQGFAQDRVLLVGRRITDVVDELARGVGAEPEKAADPDEHPGNGRRERHTLVSVPGNGHPVPDADAIAALLHGVHMPYRPEFTQMARPKSLNRETGTYAAVSTYSSFLYGQQGEVENSVLLTTIQAVGTAARFQRIWLDAYYRVQQFQLTKQADEAGMQTRRDLETLADQMGNLELDLAFSVETAADLGLGSTNARIDDFHRSLHEVMRIKTRARTVGQMFVRLGSSLRSELTAIESREKEDSDNIRIAASLTLGLLSFFLAPMGLVLAFFGINATQVKDQYSIFNWHHYWAIYTVAAALMLFPIGFALLYRRRAVLRSLFRRGSPRLGDEEPAPGVPVIPAQRRPDAGVSAPGTGRGVPTAPPTHRR